MTDRKIAKDTMADATYTPQFFMPDVFSAQNYYAFGQSMPKWSTTAAVNDPKKYRFGYNGKEDDDEWGKQCLPRFFIGDYGFRISDPRIGRFLSVDPLMKDYPAWSPYPFAMNRPIDGVDLDGLEYFFAADGRYLGNVGANTKVRIANAEEVEEVKKYVDYTNSSTGENKKYYDYNYNQTIKGSTDLGVDFGTLKTIAVTAYSESGYAEEAIMGIANAVLNHHKQLKNSGVKKYNTEDWTLQKTLVKIRCGWDDDKYKAKNPAAKNFFNTTDEDRNGNSLMKKGFEAAINAISNGHDYSDGAIGWHGADILTNKTWTNKFGIDYVTNSAKVEIGLFAKARETNKVARPSFIALKTVIGRNSLDRKVGTAATLFYKSSEYGKSSSKTGGI